MHFSRVAAVLGLAAASHGQDISFCPDEDCEDCPTSLATVGTGHPDCVVYDTETVFGGLGFKKGTGKIKYLVHGQFQNPCGDGPGSFIVRSPGSDDAAAGCGNIEFWTQKAQCSIEMAFEETFVVQFCCGAGDCEEANVPWRRRRGDDSPFRAGGSLQGAFLKFANGTIIPPLAVSSPPAMEKRCEGYKAGSYIADGEPYLKQFETQIVSSHIGPFTEDTSFTVTYTQSVSKTTSFGLSIGDPWGVIQASTGIEFTDSESEGVEVKIPVPAGHEGLVGFTPYFKCTRGSIETCDSTKNEGESCTPYMNDAGSVRGDYSLIES